MQDTHSLLIEVKSNSLIHLISAVESLKSLPVEFQIIEEKKQPQTQKLNFINKKLGEKGLEITQLLAKGKTYNEIAELTEISIDGVRYYIKKIFKTLEVNNARAAVKAYLDLGGCL